MVQKREASVPHYLDVVARENIGITAAANCRYRHVFSGHRPGRDQYVMSCAQVIGIGRNRSWATAGLDNEVPGVIDAIARIQVQVRHTGYVTGHLDVAIGCSQRERTGRSRADTTQDQIRPAARQAYRAVVAVGNGDGTGAAGTGGDGKVGQRRGGDIDRYFIAGADVKSVHAGGIEYCRPGADAAIWRRQGHRAVGETSAVGSVDVKPRAHPRDIAVVGGERHVTTQRYNTGDIDVRAGAIGLGRDRATTRIDRVKADCATGIQSQISAPKRHGRRRNVCEVGIDIHAAARCQRAGHGQIGN